ncbi:MAG: RNA 2'-phosphotransferase [Candidatus Omnitrophica bacterium]|nr:RNA 2'-phosphotransferase [Candidatus Omnitrophota bacterium]
MHRCRRVKLQDEVRISKFLSYILRHNPYNFGLQPDEYGFVDLERVIEVLHTKFPNFNVSRLRELILNEFQERFEVRENKIRARYGHTIEVKPVSNEEDIPNVLYHGTARRNLKSILTEGLKSQRRKFVHLSIDKQSALRVGKRHDSQPVILKIDVHKAKSKGVKFWKQGNVVVATDIPGECIQIWES